MTLPFLSPFYLWLKAFHVIADIAWMCGLLYLPRLFVYHCDAGPGSESSERFKVMERRLLKQITVPAMLAAWTFGILLVLTPGAVNWHAGWWHTKLLSAILLSGVTGALSKYRREFAEDRNTKSQKFFRILNEVPTVLLIVVVIMAIVQPF
jgi:putative membrane protein